MPTPKRRQGRRRGQGFRHSHGARCGKISPVHAPRQNQPEGNPLAPKSSRRHLARGQHQKGCCRDFGPKQPKSQDQRLAPRLARAALRQRVCRIARNKQNRMRRMGIPAHNSGCRVRHSLKQPGIKANRNKGAPWARRPFHHANDVPERRCQHTPQHWPRKRRRPPRSKGLNDASHFCPGEFNHKCRIPERIIFSRKTSLLPTLTEKQRTQLLNARLGQKPKLSEPPPKAKRRVTLPRLNALNGRTRK